MLGVFLVAATLPCGQAAPLPLHMKWLSSVVPPNAAGPALKDFFVTLPRQLCRMGPDGLAKLPIPIMDEVRTHP